MGCEADPVYNDGYLPIRKGYKKKLRKSEDDQTKGI
jgi:hypothetical protein